MYNSPNHPTCAIDVSLFRHILCLVRKRSSNWETLSCPWILAVIRTGCWRSTLCKQIHTQKHTQMLNWLMCSFLHWNGGNQKPTAPFRSNCDPGLQAYPGISRHPHHLTNLHQVHTGFLHHAALTKWAAQGASNFHKDQSLINPSYASSSSTISIIVCLPYNFYVPDVDSWLCACVPVWVSVGLSVRRSVDKSSNSPVPVSSLHGD